MIRDIVQPSPIVAAPVLVESPTLSASLSTGPCSHMVYFNVTASPADKVIVEVVDTANRWIAINPTGVTALAKNLGLSPPSRVDNLYNCVQSGYIVRLRAKPGFLCDTLYATVTDATPVPGALLRGCAGFKASLSGGSPNTCTVQLFPGGMCGQVRRTDFAKFIGRAYLYVYTSLPANASPAIPAPDLVTETAGLSLVAPNARGVYQGQFILPDAVTSAYILPFVSWQSADCPPCADGAFAHPTADNYPLILATEPA